MVFLYIIMVRSSYIIILSGMGDDVPILGAVVTLLEAMGYCSFWWCFYTSLWSDNHISSFYLVWEMTSQFWVQWWHFLEVKGNCCFWWCCYTSVWSLTIGQIIIYHHCIWYGRWRPNFGCSGDTFKGWWVICRFWWCFYTSVWSDHHISSLYLIWEMTSQFWVQ